jgi:hypothetical protein
MNRAAAMVTIVSVITLIACILAIAAGPIRTDDLWWHLKIGEVYATEGPWPEGDPLLHTAHEEAPVQHEWLFGVAVHLVDRALGFGGLRILHGLAVLSIAGLAWSILRRRTGEPFTAAVGLSAFLVLSWWRLFQLRPDLVSIPATLLVYRLLLERSSAPGWGRVLSFSLLIMVWCNLHSLFAIGLLLVAAAAAGIGALMLWERLLGRTARASDWEWVRRLSAAVGLGMLASLVNPRGVGQLLTFWSSSREAGIWRVHDEWTPFNPFAFAFTTESVSLAAWLLTDAILIGLAGYCLVAIWRIARSRSASQWDPVDVGMIAVAGAAAVASLASIRFLWMGFFPLLLLLGAAARLPGVSRRGAVSLGCACIVAALAFGSVLTPPFRLLLEPIPARPIEYFGSPYVRPKYHVEGVRFLQETGLEGNLFNKYGMGGFLEYWLAPRLRTFVDGRTEHYSTRVLEDYSAVNLGRGVLAGEGMLDILDRRNVDIFFGTGPPTGYWRDAVLHTAEHLRSTPGWILISRSVHHAIYLRRSEGNRANLERVVEWYRREGVPFDPKRGLEPELILNERPDWGVAHEMAPPGFEGTREEWTRGNPEAGEEIALTLALLGEYQSQLETDRAVLRRWPSRMGARRRVVHALMRMGRSHQAVSEARQLVALDRDDALSARVLRLALSHARATKASGAGSSRPRPWDEILNRFPLVDSSEQRRLNDLYHRGEITHAATERESENASD